MTDETPYAQAVRLSESGAAPAAIEVALKERGLDAEEVLTVLAAVARKRGDAALARHAAEVQVPVVAAEPKTAEEREQRALHEDRISSQHLLMGLASAGIGVALLVARGGASRLGLVVTLLGITRIVAAFARPKRLPVPPVLAADDPSPRCARHSDFASVGTCPRCGAFACAACAPDGGFKGARVCRPCSELPAYIAQQLERGLRRVSLAVFLVPLPFLALAALAHFAPQVGLAQTQVGLAVAELGPRIALVTIPFAVLAGIQRQVKHPWPAFAALGVVILLVGVSLNYGELDETMGALGVPALIPFFLMPERKDVSS